MNEEGRDSHELEHSDGAVMVQCWCSDGAVMVQ